MADIYFWRQFFILCTSLLYSMAIGFMLAFPSVMKPAITLRNSTDIYTTEEHVSWITAINGIGSIVGCFITAPIMPIFGRRISHISLNAFLLIGWIIFSLAGNIQALYAARFIQGICVGGSYIDSLILSEYVHSSRRGYFVTLKKVIMSVGVVCCHAMSIGMRWRQISSAAGVLPLTAIILTLFWPESPSHLALKGKFRECETSFKWLNGNSNESQNHLKSLMDAQRERTPRNKTENIMIDMAKKFLKKDFQKAFVVSSILTLTVEGCGRHYYIVYIIEIMMELMNNRTSALYLSIGTDLLVLIALSMSTVVIKYAKRRTILLSLGITSVVLMFLIGVLVYLKSLYTSSTFLLWFTALMLLLQLFVIHIGLFPVCVTIVCEIFPLEDKGFGSFTSCFIFTLLYAAVLKLTPVLMEHTKLYGTYCIFGAVLAMCMVISYGTVPETKDKTLQEIEDELNNVKRGEIVAMEREQLMHS